MFDLTQIGWHTFFQAQLSADEWEAFSPGRVAMIHRSHCIVWSAQGEHEFQVARFANPKNLAVGDWVCLPHETQNSIQLLSRKNTLTRQLNSVYPRHPDLKTHRCLPPGLLPCGQV